MITFQTVFFTTLSLTAASGVTAACIALFGDTRRNEGQRIVVEKFAQIALFGAVTVASLLVVSI
ncbi:hypothetical protein [Phyllobacterium calauticae]|jgi:hypothetical protein|uniref:hypothetical protein n=1 Tax=Phyllobacterium calauticae TaxID=2817027 RepID=UPI001CBCEA65|nr:hypothetical protein [Phyllobacterium calauticae]MBZ3695078.1 hypothetical protein [Phyllobacterium calauticae]